LLLALMTPASAEVPVVADWSDLPAWRTWVVLDDVGLERHWFAIQEAPGVLKRCEMGILATDLSSDPVIHCGKALHSDVGVREVPRALRRAEKAARKGLMQVLGGHASELADAQLVYLGRLKRVSFRQLVITKPHEDAQRAMTYTQASFWDVDMDTGNVDRGVLGTRIGEEPLCMSGLHARCDEPPRLLAFEPSEGWDGHLIDLDAEGSQATQTAALEALVRDVALHAEAHGWSWPPMRDPGAGMLPVEMDAGMSLQLTLDVQGADGKRNQRDVTLDLPLNQAAFEGVAMGFDVDGASARLEVDARLEAGQLFVHLGGPDADRRTIALDVDCELVRDDNRAFAPGPCAVRHPLRQVSWVGEGGVERVTVTTAKQLLPLFGPSRGPSVR
jgi:hypothetical protein